MHLPSQDRHWPGLKEVPADWPLLPAASPGPWGDFGGGGSDIPRLQCPHWGSCSCWASPRLGASLLPSGAMLSFPPGPWRGPLCPCLEVRAVPQPSPPQGRSSGLLCLLGLWAEQSGSGQMSLSGGMLLSPEPSLQAERKARLALALVSVEGAGMWGGGLFPAFSCRFM